MYQYRLRKKLVRCIIQLRYMCIRTKELQESPELLARMVAGSKGEGMESDMDTVEGMDMGVRNCIALLQLGQK